MITNEAVLARIAAKWPREGLFSSKWENLVGVWCVQFYKKYSKAPDDKIGAMFESWAGQHEDQIETINMVDDLLAYLSNEHDQDTSDSSEYLIDLAGDLFNKIRLRDTLESALDQIEMGRTANAEQLVSGLERVELGIGSVMHLDDLEAWESAFADDQAEALIRFPPIMDEFVNGAFHRDALVAICAPEKRKKSYVMLDLAVRAIKQRRKVAFFECGDMSRNQVLMRLAHRITRRPLYAGTYQIPEDIDDEHIPIMKEVVYDRGVTPADCIAAGKKIERQEKYWKLFCYPADSMNVEGIAAECHNLGREGWTPDIVICDYADILAPPSGMVAQGRDWINKTWLEMRRLSQEIHCCFITATQADASSYNQDKITRSNFSEDKRKNAHISAMLGINATPEDMDNEIIRLNWTNRRVGKCNENKQLFAAGCLDIACPMIAFSH